MLQKIFNKIQLNSDSQEQNFITKEGLRKTIEYFDKKQSSLDVAKYLTEFNFVWWKKILSVYGSDILEIGQLKQAFDNCLEIIVHSLVGENKELLEIELPKLKSNCAKNADFKLIAKSLEYIQNNHICLKIVVMS